MAGCGIIKSGKVELVVARTVVVAQVQIDVGLAFAEKAVFV
jgi:hypothetical protein